MIHIDKAESSVDGTASTLLAEIVIGLAHTLEVVSEANDTTEEIVLDTILEGVRLNRLILSGMEFSEAIEVMRGGKK